MDVVKMIENVDAARSENKPKVEVKIVKSGELPVPAEGIHKEL
jgi:peptidyl-prolyl cis-trans isomerase B (cyclophilin B)